MLKGQALLFMQRIEKWGEMGYWLAQWTMLMGQAVFGMQTIENRGIILPILTKRPFKINRQKLIFPGGPR